MKKWTQKRLLRARFRLCLLGPGLHPQQEVVPSVPATTAVHSSGLRMHCKVSTPHTAGGMCQIVPSPPGDGWAKVDEPERGAGGGPAVAAAGEQVPVPRSVGWHGFRVRHLGRAFVASHGRCPGPRGPTALPRAGGFARSMSGR